MIRGARGREQDHRRARGRLQLAAAAAAVSVVLVVLTGVPPASASCAGVLGAPGAHAIIVARALEGEATPDGLLVSPASFEVLHYVRGTGPARLRVATSVTSWDGENVGMSSVGIGPRAGETWRLFVRDQDLRDVVETACTASVRIGRAPVAAPAAAAAPGPAGRSPLVVATLAVVLTAGLGVAGLVALADRRAVGRELDG